MASDTNDGAGNGQRQGSSPSDARHGNPVDGDLGGRSAGAPDAKGGDAIRGSGQFADTANHLPQTPAGAAVSGRTAAGAMAPASADGAELPARIGDDMKFLSYAKQYVGLLMTVFAIPLISSAINVLPPPDVWSSTKAQIQMTILSSFVCLVAFAASFLLRGLLVRWALDRRWYVKSLPFALTSVTLGLAITFTALYLKTHSEKRDQVDRMNGVETALKHDEVKPALTSEQKKVITDKVTSTIIPNPVGDYVTKQTTYYLLVYPLYVFSLGIVLVTFFSIQTADTVQNLVDSRLGPEESRRVHRQLRYYADFYQLARHMGGLRDIGQELLSMRESQLLNLSQGTVEMYGRTPYVQGLLLRKFRRNYDAVSDRELAFWERRHAPGLAQQYFSLNVAAMRDGCTITRLFIFTAEELTRGDAVLELLEQHTDVGIGWAVALAEELGVEGHSGEATTLDFGVFDDGEAVALLSDGDYARKLTVLFNTPNNACTIRAFREQYDRLLCGCVMADGVFIDRHRVRVRELSARMARARRHFYRRARLPCPDAGKQFLIEVRDTDDLAERLVELMKLHEGLRDWARSASAGRTRARPQSQQGVAEVDGTVGGATSSAATDAAGFPHRTNTDVPPPTATTAGTAMGDTPGKTAAPGPKRDPDQPVSSAPAAPTSVAGIASLLACDVGGGDPNAGELPRPPG